MGIPRDEKGNLIYDGSTDIPNDPSLSLEESQELLRRRKDYLIRSVEEQFPKNIPDSYNLLTDEKIKNLVAETGSLQFLFILISIVIGYFISIATVIYLPTVDLRIQAVLIVLIVIALSYYLDKVRIAWCKKRSKDKWKNSMLFESEFITLLYKKRPLRYYMYFYDEKGKGRWNEQCNKIPFEEYKYLKDNNFSGEVIVLKYPKWSGKGWKYIAFDPARFNNKSSIKNEGTSPINEE